MDKLALHLNKKAAITSVQIKSLSKILMKLSKKLEAEINDFDKNNTNDSAISSIDSIGVKLEKYGKDLQLFAKQNGL